MTDEGPDSATKTRSEDDEGSASTFSIPLTNDQATENPMPPLTTNPFHDLQAQSATAEAIN